MDILVNGETVSIPEASCLDLLLDSLSLQGARVAIEVNREIVPRSQYGSRQLRSGDRVEIVQAIGGG